MEHFECECGAVLENNDQRLQHIKEIHNTGDYTPKIKTVVEEKKEPKTEEDVNKMVAENKAEAEKKSQLEENHKSKKKF